MPIDRGEIVELSREDLLRMYPFFGSRSLCVDSVSVKKTDSGEIGLRAIGIWLIPKRVTIEHFRDFEGRSSRRVVDLRLIPGHFWAEALGQTLGALTYLKYTGHIKDVLPTFEEAPSRYREAAFLGDRVNLCVELTGESVEEKGRLRIVGRGAAVFNERTLAIVEPIMVNILPLSPAVRALEMLRDRHRRELWVPASFDNFPHYFTQQ